MTGSTSLWGATYFLALFAAVLALPTSWFLLYRYKRSILRLMNERSSGVQATEDLGPVHDHPRPSAPLNTLIGGPDLAVNNVEPDEFLAFVSGRTRRLFINGHEDLAERIGSLETRADRDACYRIDEFFCFDDTWRPTVNQLLARCDAVVMDLRAFRANNQGSTHELELLASRGALGRTVLLVDQTTDRALLDTILGSKDGGGATLLEASNDDPDDALAALTGAAAAARPATESRLHRSD